MQRGQLYDPLFSVIVLVLDLVIEVRLVGDECLKLSESLDVKIVDEFGPLVFRGIFKLMNLLTH